MLAAILASMLKLYVAPPQPYFALLGPQALLVGDDVDQEARALFDLAVDFEQRILRRVAAAAEAEEELAEA